MYCHKQPEDIRGVQTCWKSDILLLCIQWVNSLKSNQIDEPPPPTDKICCWIQFEFGYHKP